MQPLYLDSRNTVRIGYQANALEITAAGCAMRLLPLRRISHVVTRGHQLDWEQQALTALLQAQIPIIFVDGHDQILGSLRAQRPEPAALWQQLSRLLALPGGLETYQDFIHAKSTQIEYDIKQHWSPHPNQKINGYYYARRVIKAALAADIEAALTRMLGNRQHALAQAGVNLNHDYQKILAAYIPWILHETWGRQIIHHPALANKRPSRRELLAAYESVGPKVRAAITAVLLAFELELAELDNPPVEAPTRR
ncbi:MAG: CRISPR-associated endonuclease Cas1 [Thiotrichales bacterium]